MIQVSAILRDSRDAAAWDNFLAVYLADRPAVQSEPPKGFKGEQATSSAITITTDQAKKQIAESAEKPTPLEVAIEEKKAEQDAQPAEEQSGADPFAALQAGGETQPDVQPTVEKSKKERKSKKAETAPPEPEKAEDAKLTLDDIRKASTIALELIGAPVIQEALAKFEAVDKDKNALRMSALAEADYGRYIDFLKKKVNDAAKEWPAS